MASVDLSHATMGTIQGVSRDDVVQFLGIKYASLKDRFAPAVSVEYDTKSSIDGRHIGPYTISLPGACAIEFGFIQKELPASEFTMSELDCLNLNITIPASLATANVQTKRIPVSVFIHGGGFAIGGNCWPQYDQARLVRRAVSIGKEIIGVNINYRVGLPGFLSSEELRTAGYQSNNGLRDQIAALRWVQMHISGFGGDPDNVTVIGESAGAVSAHHLTSYKDKLFKRYASLAGTAILIKPLPFPVGESVYFSVCETLGLSDKSPAVRVRALNELPVEQLIAAAPLFLPLFPVLDGDIITKSLSFQDVWGDTQSWCQEFFIGDCGFDSSILSPALQPRLSSIGQAFITKATSILTTRGHPEAAATSFLTHYNLLSDSLAALSDHEALIQILKFAHDICFLAPTVALARAWAGAGKRVYAYRFNETNPWDGPWKGFSTHILDVAYLFLNYQEELTSAQRDVALAFADDFVKFVSGERPWTSLGEGPEGEGVRVYGPSGEWGVSRHVEGIVGGETGRRETLYKVVEETKIPLDDLAAVWDTFFAGR